MTKWEVLIDMCGYFNLATACAIALGYIAPNVYAMWWVYWVFLVSIVMGGLSAFSLLIKLLPVPREERG